LIAGINYPWTMYDGRANYGCDFGRNRWGSHTGVTAHAADVHADFAAMAAAGIEVVRWFVFTDGRGGIRWNNGEIAGLDEEFFRDMDAALESASTSQIGLCLVLMDYLWFDDPQRRLALLDRYDHSTFLERVLEPFLDRYGQAKPIHSFDLINEPDWVIAGLATDPFRAAWPLERLRHWCSLLSSRLHARSSALVTLGGGRVASVREWDHAAYALDFLQVHSYPDVRHPGRDETVIGRAAASFGVGKPLLIGECPADPRQHPRSHLSAAYSLDDYLALARDGGYLGAWPWSFKGVDAFGAADLTTIAAWQRSRAAAPRPVR
jgi:hypothetical protein